MAGRSSASGAHSGRLPVVGITAIATITFGKRGETELLLTTGNQSLVAVPGNMMRERANITCTSLTNLRPI